MPATYNPLAKAMFSSTPFAFTPLLSDGDDVVSRSGTIASGLGVFVRGTILHVDPPTGAITVPVVALDCNCILAEDADATSAIAPALVYLGGKFKADALIWPGALGHGAVSDALRDYMILIESVIYTDGTLVKSAPRAEEAAAAQAVVESNRAEQETVKTAPPPEEAKPTMDSPYAYLTAEERQNNPELAEVPTTQELSEAAGEGSGTPVTLSPTSDTVAATPETSSFRVTMSAPGVGTWTAIKDAAATWLTIVAPTSPQSVDGDVTYAAAANLGALRTANITVNGQTFTLTQSA